MNRRWIYKPIPEKEQIQQLGEQLNINPFLTAILLQRGINTFESARLFFRPSLEDLHDPFLMKDMAAAVDRLKKAIDTGEKILIYGDYDVDGTTAVSLVFSYLREFYPHCDFYIPDRYAEGYGVSEAGIQWAEANGFSLIIALDLGIKASDMVVLANHKGIDFIICDHHLPDKRIPQAVAVLDPKQDDCNYPFNELSGCGIGFKLIQAFARKYKDESALYDYLDLVVVSIASDIVPINGENRILAHYGLRKLNENPRPGLKALKDIAAIKNDLEINGIVFTLGPRINAAGRVAHARGAVELLISRSEEEANGFAEKINVKNDLRREFDTSITEEALALIRSDERLQKAKTTVLFKNTWHKGVIGIVAARCIEHYYRPTVILTESNEKITGSARSVHGFDLYQAIEQCGDLLEKFGGHKYAAGLTLAPENLPAFQQRFEEVVSATITEEMLTPMVEIDLPIHFDAITPKFMSILKQMAPFGPDNQRPVFEASDVYVVNSLATFKDRHLRFIAGQEGRQLVFSSVGFDLIAHYEKLKEGRSFQMAFTIEENTFNGNTSIQLRIKDIKFA
ncbi:MAG: single-stranded-DNA-specific exonuclease RecJ [Cyclobacteriaceae bacterium]|jgi:single-stranded-DNA-specific exonuclease|nr:single-stranded-DNA-specific exonuclease RecJ [Cyclobacteriaceae bacterium]HQQ98411.1 single-stranded-DNA-specific exonuclease RecJ [Cyclobacteriaceae bacterium]